MHLTILHFFLLVIWTEAIASEIKSNCEIYIRDIYDEPIELHFQKYTLNPGIKSEIESKTGQVFFTDYVYLWQICSDDSLNGLAILENVYGKSLPITFLTIFDMRGKIEAVKIIRYREPYGGAVQSGQWLAQFIGKSGESGFKVGDEIDSISGATISSRSVSKGVQKLTFLVEVMLKEKLIQFKNTKKSEIYESAK